MVDNIQVTEGSGKTVRTDDIGGTQYQVVKLAHGADGALDGIVSSASPLPVGGTLTAVTTLGTITNPVAVTESGTWLVNTADGAGNALTSATTSPGGTERGLIVRNIPSGTQTVSGTVSVNDGAGSLTVDNGGTFAVQAAQSGTWNVGTLSTITNVVHVDDNSGTLSIDDGAGSITIDGSVTVTQATGTNLHAVIDTGSTTAVTQATGTNLHAVLDSGTITTVTNVVHVDDNAGSLTVDGTVAATQSGTWNVNNIAGTVSLPTGAATAANQTTVGSQTTKINDGTTTAEVIPLTNYNGLAVGIVDASGNQITSFGGGTQYNDGAARGSATGTLALGDDGTNLQSVKCDASGILAVQDNGGSLTVDGTFWQATQPVSGTVTANAGSGTFTVTGPLTDTQLRASAVPVSLTSTTITGTVAATQSGTWNVTNISGTVSLPTGAATSANQTTLGSQTTKINDGTTTAEVVPLTNYNALATAIVDGSGNQITSFGGGTQYTEDAAAAADPVGTVPILVRKDTPATTVSTDGDNIAQRGTNYGAAYVQVVSSSGAYIDSFGGSGGTAQADRSAFTDGSTNATPIAGVYNETNSSPTEDQAAAVRITAKRAIHVNLRDASGNELSVGGGTQYNDGAARGSATGTLSLGDDGTNLQSLKCDTSGVLAIQDNGGSLTVDGTFWQATQPVSGTITANAGTGTFAVSGPLTDTQLRATAVPVSLTSVPSHAVTNAGTFAVQVSSAPTTAVTQSGTWILGANSGVDIGDVTINNASGASAVNIQDGGNSITVDGTFWQATQPVSGTVTANLGTIAGVATETTLAALSAKFSALGQTTMAGSTPVVLASNQSAIPITDNSGSLTVDNAGTFAVQAVCTQGTGTNLHTVVDSGSITATQATGSNLHVVVDTAPSTAVTNAGTFAVQAAQSGTWNITNVSGTVSLPTGAATAAKQPALGTAGTPSSDVITVQGVTSMTALKVDGSGVTQPVSGTVSVNTHAVTVASGGIASGAVASGAIASGAVASGAFASGSIATGAIVDQSIAQGANTTGLKGTLMLANATTSAPTYSTAQSYPLNMDTAGNLRVNVVTGGTAGTQYTEDAAAAADPIGNAQIFVRADTPGALVTTDGDNVAQRGTNYGAGYATLLGENGTLLAPAQGAAQTNIRGLMSQAVALTSAPTYTTATINPLNMTTAGSLRVQSADEVAQDSTTSGQFGSLVQGAVTTSSPTYTTGQTNPLSLDTKGRLRVVGTHDAGIYYCKSTTARSSIAAYAIQCLVNSGGTGTLNITFTGNSGDATTAVLLKEGETLYGNITAVTPSSATNEYIIYLKS